jgi:SAM-dependent methyltransferase
MFNHQRFVVQARWTQALRHYLYERAGMAQARRVLEVGCGTGAILAELAAGAPPGRQVYGLDLRREHLNLARRHAPRAGLQQGEAHALPYPNGCFDLSFCHFLLLWVANPAQVLAEMARVTRPGGAVLALAEPDYSGRIDFPAELSVLGAWQAQALAAAGAEPQLGRRLAALCVQAGLSEVEGGVLGGQWRAAANPDDHASEWATLQADLSSLPDSPPVAEIDRLRQLDAAAWTNGSRVLFVPTFYAWGKVLPHPAVAPQS